MERFPGGKSFALVNPARFVRSVKLIKILHMDHRCFLRACLRLTAAESAQAFGFIVKWLFLRLFPLKNMERYDILK